MNLKRLYFSLRLNRYLRKSVAQLPRGVRPHAYYLTRGKHLRSALMYKAGRLCGLSVTKLAPAAAALELLHSATLIHDDIIDTQHQRRGSSTMHRHLSQRVTALSGDKLLCSALNNFADLLPRSILIYFMEKGLEVCRGEIEQDFNCDLKNKCSAADLFKVIRFKTGALFAAGFGIPARYAGLPPRLCSFFEECGYFYGFVFQIRDDFHDLAADSAKDTLQHWTLPLILNSNCIRDRKKQQGDAVVQLIVRQKIVKILRYKLNILRKKINQFDYQAKAKAASIWLMMLRELEKTALFSEGLTDQSLSSR